MILVAGVALFVSAVLAPVVREVELGLPAGVKISTALHDREEELGRVFEGQSGELELCSQLLLDDPATAKRLLEAAWSRTTSTWRGPANPEIRIYVLCVLVQLVIADVRWTGQQSNNPASPIVNHLSALPLSERVVVVLREFARLNNAQIAQMLGRPIDDVEGDWRRAEQAIAQPNRSGGAR